MCLCSLQGHILCVPSYNLDVLLVNCILQVIYLVLQGIKCLFPLCCGVGHYKAVQNLEGFLGWEEWQGSHEGLGLSPCMMSRAWPW